MNKLKYELIYDNKVLMKDILPNIIGYLFNRDMIEIPDEYYIEEDNGWKVYYRRNYKKILRDFNKLTKGIYILKEVKNK